MITWDNLGFSKKNKAAKNVGGLEAGSGVKPLYTVLQTAD